MNVTTRNTNVAVSNLSVLPESEQKIIRDRFGLYDGKVAVSPTCLRVSFFNEEGEGKDNFIRGDFHDVGKMQKLSGQHYCAF